MSTRKDSYCRGRIGLIHSGVAQSERTPENFTMMEAFEWYVPADQKHWQRLCDAVIGLKATGIDNLWLPPGCKGSSQQGNGYDMYEHPAASTISVPADSCQAMISGTSANLTRKAEFPQNGGMFRSG